MTKTLKCPKCQTKTRFYWLSQKTEVLNFAGAVARRPDGSVIWGTPTRRCPKCDWVGDWILAPLPPAKAAPSVVIDDDDDIEDYINHYYR